MAISERRGAAPTEFEVGGPFKVPVTGTSRDWTIDLQRDAAEEFWAREAKGWAQRRGCYVFARQNRGLTPLYVGKTGRQFQQRLFQADHYFRLDQAMKSAFGTLVVFLIGREHRVSAPVLNDLEKYLVAVAKDRNPGVMNVQYATRPGFAIKGVYRSTSRQTIASRAFQETLGLR